MLGTSPVCRLGFAACEAFTEDQFVDRTVSSLVVLSTQIRSEGVSAAHRLWPLSHRTGHDRSQWARSPAIADNGNHWKRSTGWAGLACQPGWDWPIVTQPLPCRSEGYQWQALLDGFPQHTTACWYAGRRESNRWHCLMSLVCHVWASLGIQLRAFVCLCNDLCHLVSGVSLKLVEPPPSPPPWEPLEAIDGLGWFGMPAWLGLAHCKPNHCHVDPKVISDRLCLTVFLPSLLSAGCSFLPPDVVRASSLWHVLRILTLFLALTVTMALHALKLDGVSASARHVWRDLMVSFVCLYFCWPLLRFEVASVPGRFLHGTQDPELCASWSCSVSARSVFRCFLSQLSSCLQFVSLFLGTHLEFSSAGAFCWSMFFFWCLRLTREVETWHPFMVSFSVLPFSASLCLVGYLSLCCLRQSPVWVPRLFWGMCGAVYRVFGPTLETREFLSAGWLGRSTVACISHALALSYFGMVEVAVSSCYCLRGWRLWWSILWVSGSTLWVLATSLCVFVWRGILSWFLFVWCCGCLAAGHLACRNDVAPASAWKLFFLGSGSICDSSQLASSLHGLEFPICWLCPNENTHQKWENIYKKKRRKNIKQKNVHTEK